MVNHPVFVNRSLVQKRFQTEPYLKILMGNSAPQQSDGTRCGFVCNNRFVKARNVNSLHCLLDGWAEDLQTLCTVPLCPDIINLICVYRLPECEWKYMLLYLQEWLQEETWCR